MLTLPPAPPWAAQVPTQPSSPPLDTARHTKPELGTSAVTPPAAAHATAERPAAGRSSQVDPLAPPTDPPPVKGLGLPPLDVTRVGDRDSPEARPQTPTEALFAARLTRDTGQEDGA
ncbi:hypothetical protein roselon_03382 [Roseibacterium elongatum DSM 19469]|uniref:Uncharacterized protein n=1 Tax=Roseicyclus elongatus DSM 19469 TaxID=1294273 RepID=W8SSY8_9RHOB|nr:hypothetical protein [Roseibacterium elongatum]AHM05640.1 hypothetical protein roselon_03382 [Roseibacterium elongatum DSM 19469]